MATDRLGIDSLTAMWYTSRQSDQPQIAIPTDCALTSFCLTSGSPSETLAPMCSRPGRGRPAGDIAT